MTRTTPRMAVVLALLLTADAGAALGQGRFSNNPPTRPLRTPSLQGSSGSENTLGGQQASGSQASSATGESRGFVGRSNTGFVGRSQTPSSSEPTGTRQTTRFAIREPSAAASAPAQPVESHIALRWRTTWAVPRETESLKAGLRQLEQSFQRRYHSRLELELDKGGVVVMRGQVRQRRERSVAEILVRMEPGVKGVRNLLQVGPDTPESSMLPSSRRPSGRREDTTYYDVPAVSRRSGSWPRF